MEKPQKIMKYLSVLLIIKMWFSFCYIDVEASLKDLIGAVENAALVNIPDIKNIPEIKIIQSCG